MSTPFGSCIHLWRTTGAPKAIITHSQGGVLTEHLKYLTFHNDVHPGERFFWFSTTGWMMELYPRFISQAGASIVLFDGSPGYPDINVLWEFGRQNQSFWNWHHFWSPI
ncbi:MAG: hypothetical protein R2769_17050 [Saprospiraceae bacterium]